MTKKLFILCAALVWTVSLMAQKISVVSPEGDTKLYKTLQEAINGAKDGSVVYLPGGKIITNDSIIINKKLTIIGIGHKYNSDQADGTTSIRGKLFFCEGSSESALMGCYLEDVLEIGVDSSTVSGITIRYCNLSYIEIKNEHCSEIVINQNYIRNGIDSWHSSCDITNNIVRSVRGVDGGKIANNIVTSWTNGLGFPFGGDFYDRGTFLFCNNCLILNNIILTYDDGYIKSGSNCEIYGNMMSNKEWGQDFINLIDVGWNDVFVNCNSWPTVSPAYNFHFKDEYKQYENQVGIYAGDGFNDKQLAPVPYIVTKHVDEHTDASGRLNIKIRVKASGEE